MDIMISGNAAYIRFGGDFGDANAFYILDISDPQGLNPDTVIPVFPRGYGGFPNAALPAFTATTRPNAPDGSRSIPWLTSIRWGC